LQRLYVGNLPASGTRADLEKIFSEHGRITDIDVKGGFAFVEFAEARCGDQFHACQASSVTTLVLVGHGSSRGLRVGGEFSVVR
jgi:hypothetical protein